MEDIVKVIKILVMVIIFSKLMNVWGFYGNLDEVDVLYIVDNSWWFYWNMFYNLKNNWIFFVNVFRDILLIVYNYIKYVICRVYDWIECFIIEIVL